MHELALTEKRCLDAVEGWLELGNLHQARQELLNFPRSSLSDPQVMERLWILCARAGDWDSCLMLGHALTVVDPDRPENWLMRAVALRELGRIDSAWIMLSEARERFPEHSMIPFNLACCACDHGNLENACAMLAAAFRLHENEEDLKLIALCDPALEPLWNQVMEL